MDQENLRRIYREEKLQVRQRSGRKRTRAKRTPMFISSRLCAMSAQIGPRIGLQFRTRPQMTATDGNAPHFDAITHSREWHQPIRL